jgi:phage shock protein PspC (stress-responsive transcriptional regulator)
MNTTSQYAGSGTTGSTGPTDSADSAESTGFTGFTGFGSGRTGSPALCRSADDRMIAGVAGGIARSLGIDPVIIRIAFVLATLLGLMGVALYLAGWLLIPDERTGRSLAADLLQATSARSK